VTATHANYRVGQLEELMAEATDSFREVPAEFDRPVLTFRRWRGLHRDDAAGRKAVYPAKISFPVLGLRLILE
jgi:sulfate adenylyltransferase subunit 2